MFYASLVDDDLDCHDLDIQPYLSLSVSLSLSRTRRDKYKVDETGYGERSADGDIHIVVGVP